MGGLDEFSKLSIDDQKRYRATSSQMTKFARDHAIPIAFAPPIGRFAVPVGEGKVGMVTVPLSLGSIAGATELYPATAKLACMLLRQSMS